MASKKSSSKKKAAPKALKRTVTKPTKAKVTPTKRPKRDTEPTEPIKATKGKTVARTEIVKPDCPCNLNLDELNELKSKAGVLYALCCAEGAELSVDKLSTIVGAFKDATEAAGNKLVRNGYAKTKGSGFFVITKAGQEYGARLAGKK